MSTEQGTTIYFVIDFLYFPVSYDIVSALINIELERVWQKKDNVHVVIMPNTKMRYSHPCENARGNEMNKWREYKLVIDTIGMMPSVKGFSTFRTRDEAWDFLQSKESIFPEFYKTQQRNAHPPLMLYYIHLYQNFILKWLRDDNLPFLPILQPSVVAENYVDSWIKVNLSEKPIIVVVLREAPHSTVRNSQINEWAVLCSKIDKSKYHVVVVRDFSMAMHPLPELFDGCIPFPEIVFSQDIRLALYERAHLVVSVNAGTSCPFTMNYKVSFLMFFFFTTKDAFIAEEQVLFNTLVPKNTPFLWSTPKQYNISCLENANEMYKYVQTALANIEKIGDIPEKELTKKMKKKKTTITQKKLIPKVIQSLIEKGEYRMAKVTLKNALQTLPEKHHQPYLQYAQILKEQ